MCKKSILYFIFLLQQVHNLKGDFDIKEDSIVLKHCNIHDVRYIREYNINPKNILINKCFLNELPNAVFLRFPKLKILEICESNLMHIQDFALNGLKGLESLNLSKNNLTVIKTWSDHDLESLVLLDLRRNSINFINKSAFIRYPNLTRLNLADNFIERILENSFKFNENLKYLNLGKNLLTNIDDMIFKGLHKLTYLALHYNKINYIDYYAFISLTHLKSIQLQGRNKYLNKMLLANYYLKYLGNKIVIFESELMSNLPRLSFINLSYNSIEELSDLTFNKNMELKHLDLSYNTIGWLNEYTLIGLEALEVTINFK